MFCQCDKCLRLNGNCKTNTNEEYDEARKKYENEKGNAF